MGVFDPFGVEGFAGGVRVGVPRLGWWVVAGWLGWCAGLDGVSVCVVEGESGWAVGVAGDAEFAPVVGVVVCGA